MPPQPGVFALPHSSSSSKNRASNHQPLPESGFVSLENATGIPYHHANAHVLVHSQNQDGHQHSHHHGQVAGPSSRPHGSLDDGKKDRRRKEIVGKLGKEMSDRRDDSRYITETIANLQATALQLATRPSNDPLYNLRLYAFSLERSAILSKLDYEEKHALDGVQTAYEEERERVEDEWKRGRDRVRERLLEGIEERRKRAREEKEGEGTVGDSSIDSQSRAHITRKLRNKLGTSPPSTPLGLPNASSNPIPGQVSAITSGPFVNPHSLSVDELPSPFPLPLTSTVITGASSGGGGGGSGGGSGAGGGGNGKRKAKGTSGNGQVGVGGLGKSIAMLVGSKDSEIEMDLNEIRRGNKRRRNAAAQLGRAGM